MGNLSAKLLVLTAITMIAESSHGQVVATGEFQANTYTIDDQSTDSHLKITCADAEGDFVVVWHSGQDGEIYGIFGQRFASSGLRVGTEFQINTFTLARQREPDVCCERDGDFVVLWNGELQDGSGRGVFGQQFTSSAERIGDEFQVNSYTLGDQEDPSVCCAGNGGFVALWEGEDQDASEAGIFAQRYDSGGNSVGGEFQVNSYTLDDQEDPAICCDEQGDFVAVWNLEGTDLAGRRFASSGVALGEEFVVNSYTPDDQEEAAICCSAEGDFVVSWTSYLQDGDFDGIFGQRFSRDGDRLGTEFQINTATNQTQEESAVCCDSIGNFVVAWGSVPDGDNSDVYGQRFASSGAPLGSEFQANVYTLQGQFQPALACDEGGGFVVVWASQEQDGDGRGIFGRRFLPVRDAASAVPVLGVAGLALMALLLAAFGAVRLVRSRSPEPRS